MKTLHPLIVVLLFLFTTLISTAQTRLGSIKSSTNPILPQSYNFQEYVFAEPDDEGSCNGSVNISSQVNEIFFAQTHRLKMGHPFFFLINDRPALLQIAITGSGASPDVKITGSVSGISLGTKCLKGPVELKSTIDLNQANFEDYFSVTLPKSWMRPDLKLEVEVGGVVQTLTTEELNIGPKTELNLVIFDMDFMDYNFEPHRTPIIEDFLQEIASAIPASVIRIGKFPEIIRYPEMVVTDNTEQLVNLITKEEWQRKGVPDLGNLNAIAASALSNMHQSTGDFLTTTYFGNTLNLDPGGWGGGNSFVSFDYQDITIHELGHALSLSHWADEFGRAPNDFEFLYPYAGESGTGDGRGSAWNFIQDTYEFVDPTCETNEERNGKERSDAMQRNNTCLEKRTEGVGPWDGFGDFSAMSMHRFIAGGKVKTGEVEYRGNNAPYQFSKQAGFPTATLIGSKREYSLGPSQEDNFLYPAQNAPLPGDEKINQDVYLVYGSAHETQTNANIVYKPIKFKGTLPPILDPTNPDDLASIRSDRVYLDILGNPKDITLKLTYADGSILHMINPHHSYERGPNPGDFGAFRRDLSLWSLVVPGDKALMKVELFKRPLVVRSPDDPISGNVNNPSENITASNFMDEAVFQAEYTFGQAKKIGSNALGNRVWNDVNRNGKDDNNEPGIEGVKILLWEDSDADGIPDSEGFAGSASTDENGYFLFAGLSPGKYIAFVWFVDNYDEGGPLHGFMPTEKFVDPNTDIDLDNNGRSGAGVFPGLGVQDIASGIVELTATGEPLNDGDREDDWFDYDVSGNMTVDFGFYSENSTATEDITAINFTIDPNPFSDYINISILSSEDVSSIELYNSAGYLVKKAPISRKKQQVSVEGLRPGFYIATIKNKAGRIVGYKKMVRM